VDQPYFKTIVVYLRPWKYDFISIPIAFKNGISQNVRIFRMNRIDLHNMQKILSPCQ